MEEDNNLAATLLLKTCIYLGVFSFNYRPDRHFTLPRANPHSLPSRSISKQEKKAPVPNTFRVPDICAPWDNTIGVCRLPTFLTACQLHDVEHNLVGSSLDSSIVLSSSSPLPHGPSFSGPKPEPGYEPDLTCHDADWERGGKGCGASG
ncbi:hypothetical protein ASPNIDRAFT_39421 [Aspergillus niger ATCC 1015]|uniref:Uncharacterized protein n=1 Tax=Aspergillus niger (strain ATCC 1015 / CBS 113.46 / FGSC A1144 / LSHB Ac4 / NCTC 3858a / NRRL 328 / USDA 3528.7) TaxID=380704 RepID=G3YBH2_ASPNA|nr:hypothetical protein ASPNIDRAFT_39421 [Aspergillus niger ATCC 1015]